MRKVKVVNLTNFDIGIRIHMRNQMRYLIEQGYDISIVSNPGSYITGDTTTEDGIFVKAIPFHSKITPFADLSSLVRLIGYFRKEKFDIVHTHTIKPGLLGRIAARMAGVPVVIHTIHGFHFHDEMRPSAIRFYKWIEKFGAFFCDMMMSQNREDMKTAVDMGICPEEKMRYLGNGIDIRAFHPSRATPALVRAKREELGIPPGVKVVAMIGRLVREKGFYEYFQAAKILKERGVPVMFLSIGAVHHIKGAINPEELIEKFGIGDRLKFLGVRGDVSDLMCILTLLVSASYAEGIPRNVMEAYSTGVPIVGTDVRGTREILDDGVTGLMIPVKNPEKMADAIEKILSDPQRADAMGKAAREKAGKMFDERDYFRRTDRFYREFLNRKRPGVEWDDLLKPIPAS